MIFFLAYIDRTVDISEVKHVKNFLFKFHCKSYFLMGFQI